MFRCYCPTRMRRPARPIPPWCGIRADAGRVVCATNWGAAETVGIEPMPRNRPKRGRLWDTGRLFPQCEGRIVSNLTAWGGGYHELASMDGGALPVGRPPEVIYTGGRLL